MDTSTTVTKIAAALLAAQKEMTNATKDSKNPYFKSKYADLNSIREAAQPVLNQHGIAVLQPMVQKDGKTYVKTVLLHESGEFISGDTEVVCSKANDAQAYGSGVTYARRYGLQSLVSLGAEDDDAEATMARSVKNTKAITWNNNGSDSSSVSTLQANTPATPTVVTIESSAGVTTAASEVTTEVTKSSFSNGTKKLGKKTKEATQAETPNTDDWQ